MRIRPRGDRRLHVGGQTRADDFYRLTNHLFESGSCERGFTVFRTGHRERVYEGLERPRPDTCGGSGHVELHLNARGLAAGSLDLDHVCAGVGERLAGVVPNPGGEIEPVDVVEAASWEWAQADSERGARGVESGANSETAASPEWVIEWPSVRRDRSCRAKRVNSWV